MAFLRWQRKPGRPSSASMPGRWLISRFWPASAPLRRIATALQWCRRRLDRLTPWLRWLRWPALLTADAYGLGVLLARNQVPAGEWTREWLLAPAATVLRVLVPARGGTVSAQWWTLHLLVAAGVVWFLAQRRPAHPHPDPASRYGSHGSARWATERELRQTLKPAGAGLILGKVRGRYLIHPADKRLLHNQLVAVFGGSGSRKTRSWVIPNTLHETVQPAGQGASLVITDPKSEIYARTAGVLQRHGYRLRVLNFISMAHSDRWNPLDYVETATDAADLAHNIVANTVNPNRVKGDPFWDNAEQSLLTALVLYVRHHCPPAEQHMASVLELGTEPAPEALDAIFLALPRHDPARRFYRTYLRAEEKVRSGITAGLGARLQLWNSEEVIALTAASDFRLEELGSAEAPVALYLIIPDAKSTFAPILALFWQQTFQALYAAADRQGGELPRRVRCRMDEIANCGYIPDLEKKLSTMRSRGVSVEMIWQTLDQLKNRYAATWSELLGNCDTWLYLGGNDLETARYISQKLGNTTVRVHGTGNTTSLQDRSITDSTSYTGRPLLTPDECLCLDPDVALLLRKGTPPARVQKADFTAHPAAVQMETLDHRSYPAGPRDPVRIVDPAQLRVTPAQQSTGPQTDVYAQEEEAKG